MNKKEKNMNNGNAKKIMTEKKKTKTARTMKKEKDN